MDFYLLLVRSLTNKLYKLIDVFFEDAQMLHEFLNGVVELFCGLTEIVTTALIAVVCGEISTVPATRGAAVKRPIAAGTHNYPLERELGVFDTFFNKMLGGLATIDANTLIVFSNNKLASVGCVKKLSRDKAVDCLINNAGLWIEGPLDENDPDYAKQVLEVNILGVMNLTKAVTPLTKKQKTGLIININSQGGLYAKAERGVYTATKWAITGFTKAMQPELAPFGVAVTGLYPGKMKTDMFKKMGIDKKLDDGPDTQEVAKTVEFLLGFDKPTVFPEIGVKNIEN